MEERDSWLRELIQELGERKVDTIVTDGITGRAMPDPVTALLDIHNNYLRKLVSLHLDGDRDVNAFDKAQYLLPNEAARVWLMSKAVAGLDKSGIKPADACVLQRIVSTCRELEPIVAKIGGRLPSADKAASSVQVASMPESGAQAKVASRRYYVEKRKSADIELTRRERAALSKAWELGTGIVAMQTVAMLDGDIITRITEQYASEAYAVIRQIHHEAVDTSLSTWDRLVNGVAGFFNGLLSKKE